MTGLWDEGGAERGNALQLRARSGLCMMYAALAILAFSGCDKEEGASTPDESTDVTETHSPDISEPDGGASRDVDIAGPDALTTDVSPATDIASQDTTDRALEDGLADISPTEDATSDLSDLMASEDSAEEDGAPTEPEDGVAPDAEASFCGDGVLDPDEECDEGDANSDTEPDACRTTCLAAHCGDGVVDANEVCDDGDFDETDACTPTCVLGPDLPKPTLPGQGIFNELMINPLAMEDPGGEWIELLNMSDEVLSLSTCVLRDEANDLWVLGSDGIPVFLPPALFATLLFVGEQGVMPPNVGAGVPVYAYQNVLLGNVADTIILECEGVEIDRVTWDETWPIVEGAAMALDPIAQSAEGNDNPEVWCPAASAFEIGDLGTPMMPNETCPPPAVDACRVLVSEGPHYVGADLTLSVDILEPGLTDLSHGVDTDEEMTVAFGLAPSGTSPDASEAWEWLDATPDADWSNTEGVDRWSIAMSFSDESSRAVAARVTLDAGDTWVFCDASEPMDASYDSADELTVDPKLHPCDGIQCETPPSDACEANGVVLSYAANPSGQCVIEEGEPVCDYGLASLDCGLLGQICLQGEVFGCGADAAMPTEPGALVMTEVMLKPMASNLPTGQWLELLNTTETPLDIEGCVLSVGEQWSVTIDSDLVVGVQAHRVLGRLDVPGANGGVSLDWAWGNALEFPSVAGEVSLRCGDIEIDAMSYDTSADWPKEQGASMALSPYRVDATLNDEPGNWCAGALPFGAGDFGTPGEPNPDCPGDVDPVDACFVANAQSEEVAAGTPFVAAVWLKESGLTELTTLTDISPAVVAQAGIGPKDTSPNSGGWSFTDAAPAILWEMGFAEGPLHYDGYAVSLTAPEPGEQQLAFRVSADGGNTWTFCDRVDDGVFSVDHTTDLLTLASPCHPDPCGGPGGEVCEGESLMLQTGLSLCAVVGEEAQCSWPESELLMDCALLGASCEAGECVDYPSAPLSGQVLLSEFLAIPTTGEAEEWLEFSLASDAEVAVVDLAGCVLMSDDAESWVFASETPGATLLRSDAPLLLARSADSSVLKTSEGLVYGESITLNNLSDSVSLTCSDELIDRVEWGEEAGWAPPVGQSYGLRGNLLSATANDLHTHWCPGGEGSPGQLNPLCPPLDSVLDDCRLLEPTTLETDPGLLFSVVGLLFDAGTTDITSGTDPAPGIVVETGYGPKGTNPLDPSAGWAWGVAYPDPDWDDADTPGEDRWEGPLIVDQAGIWDVVLRASVDGGATWSLCDHDGASNGYDSAESGWVTVGAGVCVPNPCMSPPSPTCEGDFRTVYAPTGQCSLVGDPYEAECTYEASTFDCSPYGGCEEGSCVSPPESPAGFGELVISEFMRDSSGPSPERGEWVELFNPGEKALDLRGCHLNANDEVIEGLLPIVVPAGGYAIIAQSDDTGLNGGVIATATLPSLDLANVADTLTLSCPLGIIDDVAYTLGWPGSAGVAAQVSSTALEGDAPALVNNTESVWCDASSPYGALEDLGSPGKPNASCDLVDE